MYELSADWFVRRIFDKLIGGLLRAKTCWLKLLVLCVFFDSFPQNAASADKSRSSSPAHMDGTNHFSATAQASQAPLFPVWTVATLGTVPTNTTHFRVAIRGVVLDTQPGRYVVVSDGSGTVFVETSKTVLPKVHEQVEISGEVAFDGERISLKNGSIQWLESPAAVTSVSPLRVRPAFSTVMTNALSIRDLSATKANWQIPVQLRGVVTVNNKTDPNFFLQNGGNGVFVSLKTAATNINPGDLVEIQGVTDAGGFAPIIVASAVTQVGMGELPKAKPATIYQLSTGLEGSQWLEVQGIVRSLTYDATNQMAQLQLRDFTGTLAVSVPAPVAPTNLLDALVTIRGACGSVANAQRQFTRAILYASTITDITVVEPGNSDPFALQPEPILSLSQFHPRQTMQHRMCIAGVVTLVDSNLNYFCMQDAAAGTRVDAAQVGQISPGDYVLASGYPTPAEYGNQLEEAVVKIIGKGPLPAPDLIHSTNLIDHSLQYRRATIKARFLEWQKNSLGEILTFQKDRFIFDVRVISPVSNRLKEFQPGSVFQLTGNYRLLVDSARNPDSFRITMMTEEELAMLESPPWWTLGHTFAVVGGLGGCMGLTTLWVVLLRRKVHQQTASLRQSEQKFRQLVEDSLVGVYILKNEQIAYANPRMAEIFGYTPDEMLARTITDLIIPEHLPLVREQIRRHLQGEAKRFHYSFRGRRKDGAQIQAEVLGTHAEYGYQQAILGMLLDVTERHQAQEIIAEQARMLDLASDTIIAFDLNGIITFCNQNAHQFFNITAQRATGLQAADLLQMSRAEFDHTCQKLLTCQHWRGEHRFNDADNRQVLADTRWTLVKHGPSKPDSILLILSDITQKKAFEMQLLRSQRLDSIGVLAGGIAHDLNNALSPILVSVSLLEVTEDREERAELTSNILTSAERAADLVKQILTFARGTDGRRSAIQPRHLLEELDKILRQTLPKSISMHLETVADIWPIVADPTQIHQVLMNLCINARDAMPDGGRLSVVLDNQELRQSPAGQQLAAGHYVRFSITDNGTGMSSDVRDRIFDPFFTTKEVGKGTGLGLSTALGIVKSHGGNILVESQPGTGSCFEVYLPAKPEILPSIGKHTPLPSTKMGNNELVLVVDDEDSIRNVAARVLTMFGYRVVTAANGKEAVEIYIQKQADIALVLLDMMMPTQDGKTTIEVLSRLNPTVKIIAASGLASEGEIAVKTSPTVRAFIQKPYTAEHILQTFKEVLHPQS